MCVRFSYDDEMSDTARDFFRNRRSPIWIQAYRTALMRH